MIIYKLKIYHNTTKANIKTFWQYQQSRRIPNEKSKTNRIIRKKAGTAEYYARRAAALQKIIKRAAYTPLVCPDPFKLFILQKPIFSNM